MDFIYFRTNITGLCYLVNRVDALATIYQCTLNGFEWEEVWGKKNSQEVFEVFHRGNNEDWISENCQWQLKGKAHLREFVKNLMIGFSYVAYKQTSPQIRLFAKDLIQTRETATMLWEANSF